MSKSLLVTRPNHDQTTNYLYYWSALVIKEATKRGIDVYDLSGRKATKSNFDSYLKSKKPRALFLNGHGNEKTITGHDFEPILESGKKEPVEKTIIYARSCEAAFVLGRKLITDGAIAFIGYLRKFIFGYTPSKITKPLEDSLAKLFLEPSNLVVTVIIKGHVVEKAHERSKKAMFENFKKMISTTATYEEKYAARWLWGNINSQVLYGEKGATI
jgi:hypothetical protein